MAELNKELNNGALPIDNALLSSEHQINLIKSLTSNEYVKKSASPIIQEDAKRLKKWSAITFLKISLNTLILKGIKQMKLLIEITYLN